MRRRKRTGGEERNEKEEKTGEEEIKGEKKRKKLEQNKKSRGRIKGEKVYEEMRRIMNKKTRNENLHRDKEKGIEQRERERKNSAK